MQYCTKVSKDSEFDQSSSRGWDEGSISGGGSGRHPSHHQSNDNSMWNSPSVGGGQSNSETRNPFFAQHMQQQQHQQQHQPHYGGYGDNGVLDGGSLWSAAVMDGSYQKIEFRNRMVRGGGAPTATLPRVFYVDNPEFICLHDFPVSAKFLILDCFPSVLT